MRTSYPHRWRPPYTELRDPDKERWAQPRDQETPMTAQDQPATTNRHTTVTHYHGSYMIQEFQDGIPLRAAVRPTEPEAAALAATWKEAVQ